MLGLFKKNILLVSVIIIFLLLRLPSLFEPYWYGDEGIYLVLGQAIRRGLVLYRQIHDNKPPSLYYLAAFSQTVFGFRLLLLLWMVPTLFLYYRLLGHFLEKNARNLAFYIFLIFTSIPLVEGNIANAEIFMLLPTITAVLFIFKPRPTSWLLAGLLLGIAFTFKVPVAIEFAFLFLWLLIVERKIIALPSITIGFFIPMVIFGFYFYSQNVFLPFLNAALLQNFGYLSSWATGTHSGSATGGGLMLRAVILFITWLFLTFAYFLKKIDRSLFFVLAWFAATIFGALLSSRPYPHYLIQVLPPLSILIGYLFSRSKQKIIIILSLIIFGVLVKQYNFYFYPVIRYYFNYYSYIIGSKSTSSYRFNFGSGVNQNYEIATYINQNTNPLEKVFIWGDVPSVYALANRLPAGRFTVAYHIVDFNAYSETIDKLHALLPKIIVIFPMPNRPFPLFQDFVNKYYYLDRSFGEGQIYLKR